jgi:oxygen-dependent protoporphyrinogen oxidase
LAHSPHTSPIAILGAGLTGLTAAWHLVRSGRRVTVFDAAPEVGGVIRSEQHPDGWLIEAGPNSLQETPAVADLIRRLGLQSLRVAAAPAAKNRYILRHGTLRALPLSPPAFLCSGVFSTRCKLRVLREFFHPRRQRAKDMPLSDFFREHFGTELLRYALDPFVSGIYAGNPDRLSARHAFPSLWRAEQEHGSLLRAQIVAARARRHRGEPPGPPPIVSFNAGLATLPRALAAALPPGALRLGAPVASLRSSAEGWHLSAAPRETFSRVLVALPGPALARLDLGSAATPSPLAPLAQIEHPPVASLFLGYRRGDVAHPLDGFGLLLPSHEGRSILGVLFNSTLFPGRAPEGHVALTVMLGGARQPRFAAMSLEEQLPVLRRELGTLLGVRSEPVFVRRTVWPQAIPQYQLGHEQHLATLDEVERSHPGLHIGGPLRDGIGLPACIAAGERLARIAIGG